MSHVSRIDLEITDLHILKKACQRLGFQFMEHQHTYAWYGRVVEPDKYPLPEGLTLADLGTCDHAIKVPTARYEIGIKQLGRQYHLLLDYWDSRLEQAVGPHGGKLKQAYAIEQTISAARKKNYRVVEAITNAGVRLTLQL